MVLDSMRCIELGIARYLAFNRCSINAPWMDLKKQVS